MVINCELRDSRKLNNREKVQNKLINLLKDTNEKFSENIASPFMVTIGDEWQGLLRYPFNYRAILNFFKEGLIGIDFRCGIGIGEITISNFELTVSQLDGSAFHKAREAIVLAKKYNYSLILIE